MAKAKTIYVCQQCGVSFPRWAGQCSSCGAWNSLVEELSAPSEKSAVGKNIDISIYVTPFSEVARVMPQNRRISTGIDELDRVLGGGERENSWGLVPGAVILLGGEPGIGKSTLLTQLAVKLLSGGSGEALGPILYVCGEESPSQVGLRVSRLLSLEDDGPNALSKPVGGSKSAGRSGGGGHANTFATDRLHLCTSTDVDVIIAIVRSEKPSLIIADSIQTLFTEELAGAPGSVGQVRESALRLAEVAKGMAIPLLLVGHVTKEGELAGPKVLEHMVDAVLELSGDRTGDLRLLRAVKNRFGATDEVGVFRLAEAGLIPVTNTSELFLEHLQHPVAGSAVGCAMEGTRPLLIEVQALVVRTHLAMPRRVGRGIDVSRLHIITALLQKYCRMQMESYDIFVSLAGGYSSKDPGLDLAIALALASSYANQPLVGSTACIGEVGLLGEVRSSSFASRRLKEASRLGFKHLVTKEQFASITECVQKLGLIG